jgi:hypothetical protein
MLIRHIDRLKFLRSGRMMAMNKPPSICITGWVSLSVFVPLTNASLLAILSIDPNQKGSPVVFVGAPPESGKEV